MTQTQTQSPPKSPPQIQWREIHEVQFLHHGAWKTHSTYLERYQADIARENGLRVYDFYQWRINSRQIQVRYQVTRWECLRTEYFHTLAEAIESAQLTARGTNEIIRVAERVGDTYYRAIMAFEKDRCTDLRDRNTSAMPEREHNWTRHSWSEPQEDGEVYEIMICKDCGALWSTFGPCGGECPGKPSTH